MIKIPLATIAVPSYKRGLLTNAESRVWDLTDNQFISAQFNCVDYSIHLARYDEVAAKLRKGVIPVPEIRQVPLSSVLMRDYFLVEGHSTDLAIYTMLGFELDKCQWFRNGPWHYVVSSSVRAISVKGGTPSTNTSALPAHLSVPDYRTGVSELEFELYRLFGVRFVPMGTGGKYTVLESEVEAVAARLKLAQ